MEFYNLKNSKHLQIVQSCFKRDLYEADAIARLLPTAKAVGYAATAPTGLAKMPAADVAGNDGSHAGRHYGLAAGERGRAAGSKDAPWLLRVWGILCNFAFD